MFLRKIISPNLLKYSPFLTMQSIAPYSQTMNLPKVVFALGGNALLRRGDVLSFQNQKEAAHEAMSKLAKASNKYQLIISHGNGPQVGLQALRHIAHTSVPPNPLDVLNAETEGSIGYLLQQELMNSLDLPVSCFVTQVQVDQKDPAWNHPTKYVGPVYTELEAAQITKEKGWTIKQDGKTFRRVVPSPVPIKVIGIEPIKLLVDQGYIVILGGGGGIPVIVNEQKCLEGREAVIDKDLCSEVIASSLNADGLVLLTDGGGIIPYYGKSNQMKEIKKCSPEHIKQFPFPEGSMAPKVKAVCNFIEKNPTKWACIGDLKDATEVIEGKKGTLIVSGLQEIEWYD